MPEAVLVSAVRTPVGRAPKGALATTRPDDLAAIALSGTLERVPQLDKSEIDDVILGCAQPEAEQGFNIARFAALRAQLPVEIPGVTVNRLCASGLEAIAQADMRIRTGTCRVVLAGGVESMSMIPMGGAKPSPNPWLAENYPASLLTMGLTAERVARHYNISREDQDAFALASHQKAIAAIDAGRFVDEIVPVPVRQGREEVLFSGDEGPRRDTSAEALARLKPAFDLPSGDEGPADGVGTVTAGNAPGITDGAAATVVASERAVERLGLQPLARIVGYAQAEVAPRWLFLAPVQGVRRLLARVDMPLEAFDLVEINEAFAAQVLADGRELGFDWSRVNVNGGAIALGHPIGASGARIVTTLLHELRRREGRFGLATLCLGGGGSVAMAFERV